MRCSFFFGGGGFLLLWLLRCSLSLSLSLSLGPWPTIATCRRTFGIDVRLAPHRTPTRRGSGGGVHHPPPLPSLFAFSFLQLLFLFVVLSFSLSLFFPRSTSVSSTLVSVATRHPSANNARSPVSGAEMAKKKSKSKSAKISRNLVSSDLSDTVATLWIDFGSIHDRSVEMFLIDSTGHGRCRRMNGKETMSFGILAKAAVVSTEQIREN